MKKIDLNVDPMKGDVLSSEELKSVSGSFSNPDYGSGSGSGSGSGGGSGGVLGTYVCLCTFTKEEIKDGKKVEVDWEQDVSIYTSEEPDCTQLCAEACAVWNEDKKGSCIKSSGVLKSRPGSC